MPVGIGYDAHALVEGRPLVLGGVLIPWRVGLEGHSDADVLTHAIVDACLGALGLGDIGRHFPDTDSDHKNKSSLLFLAEVGKLINGKGLRLINIDATLLAEEPKIAPHIEAMQAALAQALGVRPGQINIKASTNERLGFVGRGEGMAALAICQLQD